MNRFLVACALVCAQLALPQNKLLASDMTAVDYAEQGMVPPVVRQQATEPRSFFGVSNDVMVVNGDYLGTKPQTSTKYPILLLHGFLGWDNVFFLDYFYHVRRSLQDDGFTVYSPRVNPVASIETRGQALAPQIDAILRETGAEKVNIIAHSMGGLDARYLIAHGYGDRIASLTMIGTPNEGTPVPDLVFNVLGTKSPLFKAFEFLVAGVLGGGGALKPSELSLKECLWNLSKQYMTEYFNPHYRDDPNIYYQSFAGVTSLSGLKTGDIIDGLLMPFMPAFKLGARGDGMVEVDSAKHGRFRGIVAADHVNLVGHLFGVTSSRFDHMKFYKKIAWELVDMGY